MVSPVMRAFSRPTLTMRTFSQRTCTAAPGMGRDVAASRTQPRSSDVPSPTTWSRHASNAMSVIEGIMKRTAATPPFTTSWTTGSGT